MVASPFTAPRPGGTVADAHTPGPHWFGLRPVATRGTSIPSGQAGLWQALASSLSASQFSRRAGVWGAQNRTCGENHGRPSRELAAARGEFRWPPMRRISWPRTPSGAGPAPLLRRQGDCQAGAAPDRKSNRRRDARCRGMEPSASVDPCPNDFCVRGHGRDPAGPVGSLRGDRPVLEPGERVAEQESGIDGRISRREVSSDVAYQPRI